MAQTETPNFGLHKWDQKDKDPVYNATKHNENWDKLDKIIAGNFAAGLDLGYFIERSLLPTTLVKGQTAIPTPDFTNLEGTTGVSVITDSQLLVGEYYAVGQNIGWNLGATPNFVKAMIAIGAILNATPVSFGEYGIWISKTAPPAYSGGTGGSSVLKDAYLLKVDRQNSKIHLIKTDNAGAETIISDDSGSWSTAPTPDIRDVTLFADLITTSAPFRNNGYALRVDGATVKAWIRAENGTWIPLYSIADATITQYNYAGIWIKGSGSYYGRCRFCGPLLLAGQ